MKLRDALRIAGTVIDTRSQHQGKGYRLNRNRPRKGAGLSTLCNRRKENANREAPSSSGTGKGAPAAKTPGRKRGTSEYLVIGLGSNPVHTRGSGAIRKEHQPSNTRSAGSANGDVRMSSTYTAPIAHADIKALAAERLHDADGGAA